MFKDLQMFIEGKKYPVKVEVYEYIKSLQADLEKLQRKLKFHENRENKLASILDCHGKNLVDSVEQVRGGGDMVLVPREVINFLKGAGPLEGVWFSEKHPEHRGNFWWRKFLPNVQGDTNE